MCHSYFDCGPRQDCYSKKCICNPVMMFYGLNCKKTHSLSIAIWGALFLVCCLTFMFAIKVGYFKLRRTRKWWNASVTTSTFCIISVGSCFVMICSNLSRALNFGEEDLEGHFISPIALSCFGSFSICALLNVCLLWIELARKAFASQTNVIITKKFIFIAFGLYIIVFSALFYITKGYILGGFLSIVYMLCIAVVFIKGSVMLTKRLDPSSSRLLANLCVRRNESRYQISSTGTQEVSVSNSNTEFIRTAAIPKVRRILFCARNVCINILGFCCSAGLYCLFSKFSSTGSFALCCSACVLLNGILVHLWILRYLIGVSFRTQRRNAIVGIRRVAVQIPMTL